MAKRLSENQKKEIIQGFISGSSLDYLSLKHDFTKLTITRNLKKYFGEKKFKELFKKNKLLNNHEHKKDSSVNDECLNKLNNDNSLDEEYFSSTPFMEITPLECEIENAPQKDLSSINISEMNFPKTVYMIVDKKIELETKYLKDYPDWQFLSQDELNRKTIEIYADLKNAKRCCQKEQKVIKVPNTNIFKIVAPILLSKGISRIISEDSLIAL